MRTVWVFGDSFSVDFDKNPIKNFYDYGQYKGYYPKTWGKLLSEHLDCDYKNFARGGWDNYSILQSFCDNIHNFGPDDLVFVGWSPEERIRLVGGHGQWVPFNSAPPNPVYEIEPDIVATLLVSRTEKTNYGYQAHKIVREEVYSWENMIRHSLKDRFVHIWRWYDPHIIPRPYETIQKETNGKINDTHWSEKGHIQYVTDLISELNL
jgi:hypothetical protein